MNKNPKLKREEKRLKTENLLAGKLARSKTEPAVLCVMRRGPQQEGRWWLPPGMGPAVARAEQNLGEAKMKKENSHSRLEVLQPFKTTVPMQASRDRVSSQHGWQVQPRCPWKGALPQNNTTPVAGVSRQGPGGPPGLAPAPAGPHCCGFAGGKLEQTVKHFLLLPEAQWVKKGLHKFISTIHKFS